MSIHQPSTPSGNDLELLRIPQVATTLELSEKTVGKWLRAGKLPGCKIGRTWYVPKAALHAYIKALLVARRNDAA